MSRSRNSDSRGLLLLLPLIIIAVLLAVVVLRRGESRSTTHNAEVVDAAQDTLPRSVELRSFDPNEDDLLTMTAAGVDRRVAVGIIRWREAGKVYRIKEDVALCYGVTDSMYAVLEPYIHIGDQYRIKPKRDTLYTQEPTHKDISYAPFRIDTASAAYLTTLGFSARQASLIVRYGEIIGGYRSIDEFRECYAVSDEMAATLEPYIIFPAPDTLYVAAAIDAEPRIVDINTADSAALVSLSGIGAKSAVHILRYRELCGGFYSVEQLRELDIVSDENFLRFSPQVWCDSTKIVKIDINSASAEQLAKHPYISNRMLRRIVNHRELGGGWRSIDDMVMSGIFTDEEAARLAPYLSFGGDK